MCDKSIHFNGVIFIGKRAEQVMVSKSVSVSQAFPRDLLCLISGHCFHDVLRNLVGQGCSQQDMASQLTGCHYVRFASISHNKTNTASVTHFRQPLGPGA